MLRRLFSDSLIYGLSSQLSRIAGLLSLPIITPKLSAVDFGIWGIIIAYKEALFLLFFLGMNVILSNSFFKMPRQHKWLWKQIYGALLLWGIPLSIIIGSIFYTILPIQDHNQLLLLISLILGPQLIFGPTNVLGTYYYQLNQMPKPIAVRNIIFGFLTVILNVILITVYDLGFMGWIWSYFIVNMLLSLSYWIPLNLRLNYSPIFNFKLKTIWSSLKIGAPTVPHQYSAYLLNSSDKMVMERLHVSTGDIGRYNVAYSLAGNFHAINMAINLAVGPIYLKLYKLKKDFLVKEIVNLLQVIVVTATFLFSIWSKELFFIFIKNEELNNVYTFSIFIAMAYAYGPIYSGVMSKLFFSEKTKLLWKVSLIAGLLNVFLNFLLIPIFGFEVAALTTFISLMYLGFSGNFIKSIKEVQEVEYNPIFWIAIILIATISACYIVEYNFLSKSLITVSLLLFCVYNVFSKRNIINTLISND